MTVAPTRRWQILLFASAWAIWGGGLAAVAWIGYDLWGNSPGDFAFVLLEGALLYLATIPLGQLRRILWPDR